MIRRGGRVSSWGIAGSAVDAGVTGRAWLGASRGGAVDVAALALANRLVGNDEDAVGLESSGGLDVVFDAPATIAIAGAQAVVEVRDAPPVGWGSPVTVSAGARVRIVRVVDGVRTYLAVRGGLVMAADGTWATGTEPSRPPAGHVAVPRRRTSEVRVWPGPRLELLVPEAWGALTTTSFTVSTSNRVGVRLSGATIRHASDARLASEGMVEGAIQIPPDGSPIVMLADHPTTGGYPVAAVVDHADLGVVAQAAPGSTLRFVDATRRRPR